MGSTWSVQVVDRDGTVAAADVDEWRQASAAALARLEGLLSTWDPESELSRFNRSSSTDFQSVAPETHEVLRQAVALAADTGGAFDVTIKPLVDAWGFGVDEAPATPPDAERLERLRGMTGIEALDVDPLARRVRKRHPLLQCDVAGLVPGFAADRLAAWLTSRGRTDFLVDVGGEMVARGRNAEGQPWRVGVELPGSGGRALARVVPLAGAALATSGDYQRYREVDGVRLTHIIDPRTGHPIRHRLASVTVTAADASRADGLATALMVLGPEQGMALAERLGVAALLLVRRADGTFEERWSTRMREVLREPAVDDPAR